MDSTAADAATGDKGMVGTEARPPAVSARSAIVSTEKEDASKIKAIAEAVGSGISQRPTAVSNCIIVASVCATVAFVAWVVPWPTVISAMCGAGGLP